MGTYDTLLGMCATNIWAVNQAAYTDAFVAATTARLGVAPRESAVGIESSHIRPSHRLFTLVRNQCDCRAAIGLGDGAEAQDEIALASILSWIHDLPTISPHISRLAVVRAWSPDGARATPTHTRTTTAPEVDEATLRTVRDNELLVVDY